MRVLLLMTFLGLSQGLQPGYEYKYRYRGVSATGMPRVNSQVAGSAFRIEAKVQVITKEDVRIQFSNIWAGDMNERTLCEDKKSDSDDYEKMNFGPLEEFLDQLESPFGVKLLDDQMKPFIFADGDAMWVRNLKRAFVHVLHIPENAPYLGETPILNSPSFQRMESSPLGECPTWYTVTPLGGISKPKPLSSDAQSDLDNTLWKLTKSVDFDNCLHTVSSHTIGVMLEGKSNNRNCGEDYVSTATTGLYYLRGGPRGVRIEKGVQEGSYIVDYEQVHIYTNQSIDLMTVANVDGPLDVSGSQYAFKHEIDDLISWESVNESGQKQLKSEVIQQTKKQVMKQLPAMMDAVTGGQPFNFAEDLDALSKAVAVLSMDDLQELFDGFSDDENARNLFMKVLTVSGLEIPYQFILEKFKDSQNIGWDKTDTIIHFIFNAPTNLKTTKMIKPIMNWVMTLSEEMDINTTFPSMNFATLATRMCLNPCGREYLGNTGCKIDNCKKIVEDTFLPWLEQGLNDESQELWMRMGYMMSIYNFNSEKIIPIIRPYVIGAASTDVRLRVSAIYALRKDDMPYSTKNEIFQLLMAIFDNYQEHYSIREAAFGVMLFWNPEASWWQYMALNTWRDPNNNVVSLISNVIYTYKEYRPAAKRVASLTKPVKPKSLSNSFLAYNKDGKHDDMMRYWYEFFFSGNDEGVFPRMVSTYIRLGFINTNFNGFKYTGYFDGHSEKWFWIILSKLLFDKTVTPDPNFDNIKAMYDEIVAKLEVESKVPAKKLLAMLHYTIFNNIQLLIPANFEKLEETELSPENILRFLGSMNFNTQAFVNTGRISHAYADEVGVPVIIQNSQPNFFSLIAKSEFQKSGNKASVNVDFTFRMDRLTQSTTRALIPWTGTAMVTGIDNRQVLVLPFNFQISYNPDKTELTVAVNPTDMETKEHLGLYNTPFSVRAPIVTPFRLSSLPDFKPMRKGTEVIKDDLIFPFTGFNIGAVFVGDVSPMFTRANANNFYANFFTNTDFDAFSPTNKFYEYKIGADYSKSKANSFDIFFKFIKGDAAKEYAVLPDEAADETNAVKFGIIFKADGEMEVSHFDTEFAWVNGYTSRYHSIMHLKVHSGPYQDQPAATRCIFLQMSSPDVLPMTSYKEYLEMELSTNIKAEIFYGVEDCLPHPLMTLKGKMDLTDEKKQWLGYEKATDCQKNLKDPDNFNKFSYDQAEIKIKWEEDQVQQDRFPFASYLVTYFIPGVLFPQAYIYYGPNDAPERTAILEAFKRLDGWYFKFEKPNVNAIGEQVQIPILLEDFLMSPKPYEINIYDRLIHGNNLPICYATNNKFQTFDELTFNHELSNCWTVAVWNCMEQENGLLRVRNNGGFEVSMLWTMGGFEVYITKDQVKVNQEVIEPGTTADMYQVEKVDDGMLVMLTWGFTMEIGFTVKVTGEGISIEVHPTMKGLLCGACSNYDGEDATATGPKGCSYSDYDMFMASWALPGDGCDDAGLAEKKTKVAEYQATCNKQFVYPTGTVLTAMKESCYEYNYDVRTEGDYVCTSTEPISTCKPGCTSAIPYAQDVLYDCVAGDGVSSKIQTIKDLAAYAKPGCHYYKRIWSVQSQGCQA